LPDAAAPATTTLMSQNIAFQGEPGAYSHQAARAAYPALTPLACPTFEDAFAAVQDGTAALAMIPIENSLAGRVADVHHLLAEAPLYIVAERFEPIRHQLVGVPGATLAGLQRVRSHPMALGQCRKLTRRLGLLPVKTADTAGAAREVAAAQDPAEGAYASRLAADIHGLDVLMPDVADAPHNATRFVVLSKTPDDAEPDGPACITSFVFRVRNVPAALYKAMGGFATNGVNMTKLESYQLDGSFTATQFYADVEGHPSDRAVRLALEELQFFSSHLRVLGVYPADPFRQGTP